MFEIFDGNMWSAPAYVTVSIVPVNDNAPVVALDPAGQPFIEGDGDRGVLLLKDLTLTDGDHAEVFNLTEAHVRAGVINFKRIKLVLINFVKGISCKASQMTAQSCVSKRAQSVCVECNEKI